MELGAQAAIFIKKLNGFKGELTMAETRFYPEDHPTRKGCKIVACEADQTFLDELYKYPKDHAFSIRFGGNLYIRGGERIDPDDPDAVRQRRPKLTRNAAKKFIQGSGEDILNNGQRVDDEEAKRARDEHMRKYVGVMELFTYSTRYFYSNKKLSLYGKFWGVTIGKKLLITITTRYRESNNGRVYFNWMVGNNKVGRKNARINERKTEENREISYVMSNYLQMCNSFNDPAGTNVYIFKNFGVNNIKHDVPITNKDALLIITLIWIGRRETCKQLARWSSRVKVKCQAIAGCNGSM